MQKATDDSNAASAEAPCPVQVLMRQISGLDAAYGELCTRKEGPTDDEKTDIWEANRILRELVSITRAESKQGALFQIKLAKEAANEMTENWTAFASQTLLRLLDSAAYVFRKDIGDQAADEAVGERLGDRAAGVRQNQDSLRMIEEAIANRPVGHLSKFTCT